MENSGPAEICEYLGFRVSPDYKLVRFDSAVYDDTRNELCLTFLYDESIKNKVESLKSRLESAFRDAIKFDITTLFEYKSSFIDMERLALLIRVFLKDTFSLLTLDLDSDNIKISENGGTASRVLNAEITLQKNAADYILKSPAYEKFLTRLREDYFCGFNVSIVSKPDSAGLDGSIDDIEAYAAATIKFTQTGTDKVRKVSNVEYLLGKPIKERPIKIEFLAVSPDEQVIAGQIGFLTGREYTKKDTGEKKPYWTFILDDGERKQNCVFFPNTKTLPKFDMLVQAAKLGNEISVCAIGVNDERNGRVNFSVKGISFCDLV